MDDRYLYLRLWAVAPRQLENDLLEELLNTVAALIYMTPIGNNCVHSKAWAQETGNVTSQS